MARDRNGHPTQIALFALVACDRYLEGDPKAKDVFLAHLRWILENAVPTDGGGLNLLFSFEMGHEKGAWGSITLGFAISALVRGFVETKDVSYLDAAKAICKTLLSPSPPAGIVRVRRLTPCGSRNPTRTIIF